MIIIGIISSIIIFSIIVLIHEYGHFKAARVFGVRVEEFGLGIPPRAKKMFYDKEGTLFSLNWLPLGGFVKLTGEQIHTFAAYDKKGSLYNNENLEKDIKKGKNIYDKTGEKANKLVKDEILKKLKENNADYNLINKPAWQQTIIILAGVFMNFMLAIVIFSILFFIGIKPIGVNTQIKTDLHLKLIPTPEQAIESGLLSIGEGVVLSPVAGSNAENAGVKSGDLLVSINNNIIKNAIEVQEIINNSKSTNIDLWLIRNKKDRINIQVNVNSEGKIGTYLSENIIVNESFEYKYGLLESVKYGTIETYNQSLLTFKAIGSLVRKIIRPHNKEERQEAISQVSGPIGIVDFITGALSNGIVFLVIIGAIISINLGVFNLLPIPALDGGRFIFIIINGIILKVFGKKAIGEKTEGIIHVLFFLLLIALSLLIAYNDINKMISVSN